MKKIFFSYSRVDGAVFAKRLAGDLKKKGFDVWIDQEDIRAGLDWDLEIEKALKSCDCVLFLETEKSVVSNNVLDEVYYAMEQNKKVIPLIYVDSNTPFRLNRLQHIDFTGSYDTGLASLVNELTDDKSAGGIRPDEKSAGAPGIKKKDHKGYYVPVIAGLLVVLTAVFLFNRSKKDSVVADAIPPIVVIDTSDTEVPDVQHAPLGVGNKKPVPGQTATDVKKISRSGAKKVNPETGKAPLQGIKPSPVTTENTTPGLIENLAGNWKLIDVTPKAKSQNGYIRIEVSAENKATIKAYVQFYYPDSKAPSYLTIFNAFAKCNTCLIKKQMDLVTEDIAVGSRTIKKLETDQPDGGKAGDVVLDAHSNKSMNGKITLEFVDPNHAIMKVKQPATVELAYGSTLDPFVYQFQFKKND